MLGDKLDRKKAIFFGIISSFFNVYSLFSTSSPPSFLVLRPLSLECILCPSTMLVSINLSSFVCVCAFSPLFRPPPPIDFDQTYQVS
jgi:hypothetical protein